MAKHDQISPTHKGGQGKHLSVPTRRVEFNEEFWENESTDDHLKLKADAK